MSRPGPLSKKAMAQQTTKLVNVLIRNSVLLSDCLDESKDVDDEKCNNIMRRVSAAVQDWRFQSWRQVKSWMRRHRYRQERRTKVHASSSSSMRSNRTPMPKNKKKKGGVSFNTAFNKYLVPILNTSEMTTNLQKFLDSVTKAFGTYGLIRAFRHRLARDDELPEDIRPLIFSPLFLKAYERQVRKVKSAAPNRTDSDDSETEWSESAWEEEEEEDVVSNWRDTMRAAGTNVLPSIEQENGGEDDYDLVTGESPNRPSAPIEGQVLEIRAPLVRMSHRTRHEVKCDARRAGRNNSEPVSRARLSPPPPLPPPPQRTFEHSTRQPVPDPVRVSRPMEESARTRESESESLCRPAPNIRPFADFTTPAVSEPPDPDTGSILRPGSVLRNSSGCNNMASLNKVVTTGVINDTQQQHVTNTCPEGKSKTNKNIKAKYQREDVSISYSQGATPSTSQTKDGPITISNSMLLVRETPAILRAENQKQDRKFAKPLVPTKIPSRPTIRKQSSTLVTPRGQGEIRPPVFYNPSTEETGVVRESNARVQVKSSEQLETIKPCSKGKENMSRGTNKVAQNISRQSLSDDELSLPSLEEIYGPLLTGQGRSSVLSKTKTAQKQIEPEFEVEQLTQPRKSSKKRRMREPAEEYIASFPTRLAKRMKLSVGVGSRTRPEAADSTQGEDDRSLENGSTKPHPGQVLSSGSQGTEWQKVQASSTRPQQFENGHVVLHPDCSIGVTNNDMTQGMSRHIPTISHPETHHPFPLRRGQTLPPPKARSKSKPKIANSQVTNDSCGASAPRHGTPGRGKRARSRRPAWAISSGKGNAGGCG
ncbi:hypothetical protein F4859DRAFT_526208 [Xylaria cf. heliscus]|nr:hypothetical protein F4859DRAFT_526208 [Xylaria cf. heliscus]